jgi:hypothetical protein
MFLHMCLGIVFSRRHVLAIFPKILLFAMFSYAFTMACMSYTGTTMIQNSELVGKCPISSSRLLPRLCFCNALTIESEFREFFLNDMLPKESPVTSSHIEDILNFGRVQPFLSTVSQESVIVRVVPVDPDRGVSALAMVVVSCVFNVLRFTLFACS